MDFRGHHRAVYVISVAAELAGMHPQTLRIYERKGLVDPARTGGGSRRYSDADIELLRRIAELTGGGLNLEGVRRVIALEDRVRVLESELEQLREQARRAGSSLVPLRQEIARYEPPSDPTAGGPR